LIDDLAHAPAIRLLERALEFHALLHLADKRLATRHTAGQGRQTVHFAPDVPCTY